MNTCRSRCADHCWPFFQLTFDPCVLTVTTVVVSPSVWFATICYTIFPAITLHIVQPDHATAGAICSATYCHGGATIEEKRSVKSFKKKRNTVGAIGVMVSMLAFYTGDPGSSPHLYPSTFQVS